MSKFNGPYRIFNGTDDGQEDWYDQYFKEKDLMILLKNSEGTISHVLFLCPCMSSDTQCGSVRLPVDGSRSWSFKFEDGLPTIAPSILQTGTCKGHYFIEKGMVRWC
jgi:hypothetical protein